MDESSLSVHEIKLVVYAAKNLCNGRGIGNHADGTHDLRQIAARYDRRRLVVNPALKSCGTPVDELNGPLRLDSCDRGIDVLRDDIPSVHHATRHILAMTRVAL